MGQKASHGVKVEGSVVPGYETVRDIFQDNFNKGREESAQLCVYVGEEKVIDLWGSADPAYTPDTLTNVFSSTKSLTSIAMAALYDQDLLDYDAKISTYWPEFGQAGKGDTTIADLMRHECGLVAFDTSVNPEDCLPAAIKDNKLGRLIETQQQVWPKQGRRQYHGITRGWIANEVFRRIHPKGNTIGEYLQECVSAPLSARVYVGVGEDQLKEYAPVSEMKMSFVFGQSLIPRFLGRGIEQNFLEIVRNMIAFRKIIKDSADKPPALTGMEPGKPIGAFFNQEIVRRGETSSANGNCSARGLAKVAAAMANGGSFQGVTILGPKGWEALHAKATLASLGFSDAEIGFTQGGVAELTKEGLLGREGYYGWMGYGGSIFQWHPKLRIGIGYCPTILEWFDLENSKARVLQEEVVRCAEKLGGRK